MGASETNRRSKPEAPTDPAIPNGAEIQDRVTTMTMTKLEYTVTFNTPAFLGNAEQQAQWRTPPFKALLRQWWRVVKAREVEYDHRRLLQEENRLFGAAADDGGGSHRSLVRFRLSAWSEGALKQWPNGESRLEHPEVKNPEGRPRPVGAQLYLGYGPLTYRQGNTALNNNPIRTAINDQTTTKLSLTLPEDFGPEITKSIQLAAWFGTLGSRSRNGWGALQLSGENIETIDSLIPAKLEAFVRNLNACLQLDWPHAIGGDGKGPLVWKTPPLNTWREAMKELARLKIAFRTQFKFTKPGVNDRHILAYPVTKHNIPAWGNQARLANQIRFKVAKTGDKYLGIIVHLPCRLPDQMASRLHGLPNQVSVWQSVHKVLDQELGASSKPWRS